jgi:hypothetical protein
MAAMHAYDKNSFDGIVITDALLASGIKTEIGYLDLSVIGL